MKKALLIIALFIGFGNINAQENSPNKKQTFNFIVNYIDNFNYIGNPTMHDNVNSVNIISNSLENQKITLSFKDGTLNKYCEITIDLSKISKVSGYNNELRLHFNSSAVRIYFSDIPKTWYESKVNLKIIDATTYNRLLKALEHLIELNGNKIDSTLFDH
jgi:hypothetical protein